MNLNDPIWQTLTGGYETLYDASAALLLLEQTNDEAEMKDIFGELWNELHHQGDVGTASYLAVPQLVRICRGKNILNADLLGLCMVIEQQRYFREYPDMPDGFDDYYQQGLDELKEYVFENINSIDDEELYILALATMATCSGRIKLGKAIMEFADKDILEEFFNQF